jgi:hypothetical protein
VTVIDELTGLRSDTGIVRTARKPHRCVCADAVWYWEVKRTGRTPHGVSWSARRADTLELAQAERAWLAQRHPEDTIEITEVANPNYRPDCFGDIAPGDRYWEYLGAADAYRSGMAYCRRCALAVWGSDR